MKRKKSKSLPEFHDQQDRKIAEDLTKIKFSKERERALLRTGANKLKQDPKAKQKLNDLEKMAIDFNKPIR
jgi:hypothetical protein